MCSIQFYKKKTNESSSLCLALTHAVALKAINHVKSHARTQTRLFLICSTKTNTSHPKHDIPRAMCQCDTIEIESKLTRRLSSSHLVLTDAMGAIDIQCEANTARAHDHTLSSQFDLLDGTVLLASAIVHRAIGSCSSRRLTIRM